LGIDFSLRLPHERFGRAHGACAGFPFDLNGNLMVGDAAAAVAAWLPTAEDVRRVRSTMQRELAPDRFASWIAPSEMRLGTLLERRGVRQ
jgi:benzoyl-CoA 2,3-dioxygenase component B